MNLNNIFRHRLYLSTNSLKEKIEGAEVLAAEHNYFVQTANFTAEQLETYCEWREKELEALLTDEFVTYLLDVINYADREISRIEKEFGVNG